MTGIVYRRNAGADAQYARSEVRGSNPRQVIEASVRVDLDTADHLAGGGNREDRVLARRTLIHEIGHHVHAEADHDDYFSPMPGRSGRSEALADNYADKNARHAPSVYDQIANAKPGEPGHRNQRSWGASNVSAYRKAREAGTQPR